MKSILLFAALLICLQSTGQHKEGRLQKFVYDYEKDFTSSQSDSLQQLLQEHYLKTGDEIVVVTTGKLGDSLRGFAERFGAGNNIGKQNTIKSMLIILSINDKTFGMIPNGMMQSVITQQVLDQIKPSGYTELKAHKFFEGIWKESKASIDFLENARSG